MNIERPKRGYYNYRNRFNPSAGESQARYAFAADHISRSIKNKDNLIGDMSCGIGESTLFLESQIKERKNLSIRMFGADIDSGSVIAANSMNIGHHTYSKLNLGDSGLASKIAQTMGGEPNFDAIACIETIEHIIPITAVNILLANLHDLLAKKSGTLVLSSPNRRFFADERYRPYTRFHAQEFNIDEFSGVIEDAGFDFSIYAQRPVSSRIVRAFDGLRKVANQTPKYRRLIGKIISMTTNVGNLSPAVVDWKNDGKYEPKYFVAVCHPN